MFKFIATVLFSSLCLYSYGHDFHNNTQLMENYGVETSKQLNANNYVKYLGNEALFIEVNESKILFDPFFHDNIGIYQLVPDFLKNKITKGLAPFNNINVIFISHAHRDHFAVDEVVSYLLRFSNTKLVAPQQALDKINAYLSEGLLTINQKRLVGVTLGYGDKPWQLEMENLIIDAVRIPHAGWPSRAEVENMVFRVTLKDAASESDNASATVMHMGDADPDDDHFLPYKIFWRQKKTDVNFPPYWFLYSAEGRDILDNIIGAKVNIGVHVPMEVPKQLQNSGREYFSTPGEIKALN